MKKENDCRDQRLWQIAIIKSEEWCKDFMLMGWVVRWLWELKTLVNHLYSSTFKFGSFAWSLNKQWIWICIDKNEWCLTFTSLENLNFLIHLKFISCSSFLHLWWQTLKIKTFETENGLGIKEFNFKTEPKLLLTKYYRKGWINPSLWA